MSAFHVNKSTNGQYFWTFRGNNGEPICHSETYTSKDNCLASIDIVKKQSPTALVLDHTAPTKSTSYGRF